jgi:hypothetical protein
MREALRKLIVEKKASVKELLSRPCCGSGCENCPYDPPHHKGNTQVRASMSKASSWSVCAGLPSREMQKTASEKKHPYGVVCAVCEGEIVGRNRGKPPQYKCENGHLCDDARHVETKEVIRYTDAQRLAGQEPITMEMAKSAARIVRKERVEVKFDDHCPHCDHKFHEKGYPRPDFSKLPDDEEERERMIMDGECDDVCPNCGGIVDPDEVSDDDIEAARKGWGGDVVADGMKKRRDNQRKRREAREKSAAHGMLKMSSWAVCAGDSTFRARIVAIGGDEELRGPNRASESFEKSAVVKQDPETGKWILWTKDGKRKLGTHDTPEEAYKQEYAIQKSQEREKSANAWKERLRAGQLGVGSIKRLVSAAIPASDDVAADASELFRAVKAPGNQDLGPLTGVMSRSLARRERPMRALPLWKALNKAVGKQNEHVGRIRSDFFPDAPGSRWPSAANKGGKMTRKTDTGAQPARSGRLVSYFDEAARGNRGLLDNAASLKLLRALTVPGTPNALRRHEIGHLMPYARPGKWIKPAVSKLWQFARRNPGSVSAALDGGPLAAVGGTSKATARAVLLNEALAQAVAGTGESRSARNFRAEYLRMGRARSPELRRLLPSVMDKDPTGLDGAILSQLHASYGVPLFKSAKLRPIAESIQRLYFSKAFCKLARFQRFHRAQRNPSEAQIQAHNYKMGHVDFHGLDITIENEKGSVRRGVDSAGKQWETRMTDPYGYIRSAASGKSGLRARPKGNDGDHIDVFLGPDKSSELVVAIDQYKGDTFDETKFVLGTGSREEGEKLYLRHYPKGWKLGPVSTCTIQQLKDWLSSGKHKRPFKGQLVKAGVAAAYRLAASM